MAATAHYLRNALLVQSAGAHDPPKPVRQDDHRLQTQPASDARHPWRHLVGRSSHPELTRRIASVHVHLPYSHLRAHAIPCTPRKFKVSSSVRLMLSSTQKHDDVQRPQSLVFSCQLAAAYVCTGGCAGGQQTVPDQLLPRLRHTNAGLGPILQAIPLVVPTDASSPEKRAMGNTWPSIHRRCRCTKHASLKRHNR